jgi:hypothetical protein
MEPVKSSAAAARSDEKAELERVLSSEMFRRSPALRSFLSYVGRECFHEPQRHIKEYEIAVEALGRGASFDPSKDSIVRVEASKLRRRLEQYYATTGTSHSVQVRLPHSGYMPAFKWARNGENGIDLAATGEAQPADGPQPGNGAQGPGLSRPDGWVDEHSASASDSHSETHRPLARTWVLNRRTVVACAVGVLLLGLGALLFSQHRAVRPLTSHGTTGASLPAGGSGATAPVDPALRPDELRIAVGASTSGYMDSRGSVWLGDRYFTGGERVYRPDRRILRTLDPILYQNARQGNFRYDIPLKPGVYELHLHFAEILHIETQDSGTEADRRFDIELNGKPLLSSFDISLDTPGSNTADERVFKDISPAQDGYVHLAFRASFDQALLSGLELLPATAGTARPIRILAGPQIQRDHQGRLWGADRYFFGGHLIRPLAPPTQGTEDPSLFIWERFGNFSYFIPVADGRYVTLRFAELRRVGTTEPTRRDLRERRFDIYCNGVALAREFDILKEAGAVNFAVQKTFHGLRPNAQGKLVLSFVPVVNYANVHSIEVIDESQ